MGLSAKQYECAEAVEADYLRMFRLRNMDGPTLKGLLSGDPVSAAPWIESAARYGVAEAQLRLGQMRLDGTGVSKNPTEALRWFERAAHQGLPEAMNMAGRCYENGWGTVPEPAVAARWYSLSAKSGHDWGEYNLGHLYFDGRGVPQDREIALQWYLRAANQGHARAMNLVGRCFEEGWGAARDVLHARGWYQRSAEGGYFRGQFNFATCLMTEGRMEAALEWFSRAYRDAPDDGKAGVIDALLRHPDRRLAAFAIRIADGAPLNAAVTAAPERQ